MPDESDEIPEPPLEDLISGAQEACPAFPSRENLDHTRSRIRELETALAGVEDDGEDATNIRRELLRLRRDAASYQHLVQSQN